MSHNLAGSGVLGYSPITTDPALTQALKAF
jgi:hypothetical protein